MIITWVHYGCPINSKEYLYNDREIYFDGCKRYFNFIDFREIDFTGLESIFNVVGTFQGNNTR